MKNNFAALYALLLVVGDFLAILLAFGLAFVVRFRILDPELAATVSGKVFVVGIVSILPVWIIIHALLGLYSHSVYERRFIELGRLLVGSIIGIMSVVTFDFFSQLELLPGRLVPIYGVMIGFTFLVGFRSIARAIRKAMFRYGFGISNLLIVGDTPATERIARNLSDTLKSGQNIIGIVGRPLTGVPQHSSFKEAIASTHEPIHSIIQTELYDSNAKNNEILAWAQENHVSYRFVPGNSDLFIGNIEVELFYELPMLAVHQTSLIGWGRIHKRLFDLIVSTLVIIVASPLLLLVALTIKLTDPKGAVLFRQTRLTRFNTPFTVLKFRTFKHEFNGMSPEEIFTAIGKPELIEKYRKDGDQLENDFRVTAIGRILRRTSLDELPQLFNVIKGDLSLVGPRALIPEEINAYARKHSILSVKSGITGLAQISGRKDISFAERRKLDIYYVQNWSIWLDISILLRTLRVALTGGGAK